MARSRNTEQGVCADCGRTVNLYVPSGMDVAFPRAHKRPDKTRCRGANMRPLPPKPRVTFSGTVHLANCSEIKGMTWEWAGRNNLNGDTPCSACLPDGLPPGEAYRPSAEEAARLRSVLEAEAVDRG